MIGDVYRNWNGTRWLRMGRRSGMNGVMERREWIMGGMWVICDGGANGLGERSLWYWRLCR